LVLGRRTRRAFAAVILGTLAAVFVPAAGADVNLGTDEGQTYIGDYVTSVPAGLGATAIADCPAGTHVIGGGLYQSLGPNYNILTGIYPLDGPDADASRDDRFAAQIYSFTDSGNQHEVLVVCAGGTQPTYPTQDGTVAGEDNSAARTAFCPEAMHVSSGGVRMLSGTAASGEVNSSYPVDGPDADSTPDDGWGARVVNIGGGSISFRTFAICRDSMPVYRVQSQSFPPGSASGAIMYCENPYGYGPVMGGGAKFIGGTRSRQNLTSTYPSGSPGGPPSGGWIVRTDNAASGSATILARYSVCKP
jgi:hypothetical protein